MIPPKKLLETPGWADRLGKKQGIPIKEMRSTDYTKVVHYVCVGAVVCGHVFGFIQQQAQRTLSACEMLKAMVNILLNTAESIDKWPHCNSSVRHICRCAYMCARTEKDTDIPNIIFVTQKLDSFKYMNLFKQWLNLNKLKHLKALLIFPSITYPK